MNSGVSIRSIDRANDELHARVSGDKVVNEAERFHAKRPASAMSVDVEDYFQVSAFENRIGREDWDTLECRIPRNVERILEIFADTGVKATFFTLGWVAEKMPSVVRDIVAEGHEMASHGWSHARVWSQTQAEFLEDVSSTRKLLEDVSGQAVTGYRAPSFSINSQTLWAHDVLQQAGYRYSSSIYPVAHDHYGLPSCPRFPFRFDKDGILEIPLTCVPVGGRNRPCAGGGYFRFLPLTYSRWALRRVVNGEGMPAVFYFHPWELDPDQPRVDGIPLKSRFRHYVNLGRFEQRLTRVLREFEWGRMDDVFRAAL